MHKFASFNGEIIESGKAFVPAPSSALFYGSSVFTTIAVFDAKPWLWEKHWARLTESAAKLRIELSGFSHDGVESLLFHLLKANEAINGRARITFFDNGIWPDGEPGQTKMLITTADLRELSETFRITRSPYRINTQSPLAGVKSGNYLGKIIAMDEARSRGFDEAVVLNERGEVTSGAMANIFWLKGGELLTPSLRTGCLAGTTREFVMENIGCRELEAAIEELNEAEVIFLTSAGLGIISVAEFNGRRFLVQNHPIVSLWPGRNRLR